MAEAVVSVALETLGDLLLEESKFLLGVSSEVKGLQTQLKELQCLLEDADGRQHESKTVVNWIAEIRDLAHRSEDAIETYAVRVSLNRRRGFFLLLRRFSCALNEGSSLHQIGSEISAIKSEIARVCKSMHEYGIRSIIQGENSAAAANENQQWRRQTFPFEIEDCFVGKDEELKRLVSLVVDDKQHRLISIWGMGGIGKTTMARKAYNHICTRRSFDSFGWVCITQQCQIRQVLEDVLKQLNPEKGNDISNLSNTELIIQLCHIQISSRCIVVLDDLWEIDHWNGLKHAFIVQGLRSKILLTTRKRNVANNGFAFEIDVLNAEDGWQLLKKKAFPHSNIPDFPIEGKLLQKLGEEMVHKCGHLPLVISLLGGILSKRKSMKEWELVNNNINAYLYRGEGTEKENEIHGVLDLSYEDLPYHLKPCFLYMGQFKEDQTINVYTLYRLWIAQGMISHKNQGKKETLMNIAELYLSELASRCIVQVQDYISEEKYRSCKLHDVVRELCLSKGKKEDFCFQVVDYQGGKFSTLLHESLLDSKARHLAIYFYREIEPEHGGYTVSHEDTSKHVRSLQFLNYIHGKKIEFPGSAVDFQKFKLLRVLVFQRFQFPGRKLPRGIGNLIHLRYLFLRKCELDELPSCISNLTYLNTLDLLYSRNVRVPNVLKKMFRLKHLLLPSYDTEKIENYRLSLEGLSELETLYGLNSLVHDLKSVTKMKNLISLGATLHDNESLSRIINAITTSWKNLHFCTIVIRKYCNLTATDEGLMILKKVFTCLNIHDLSINVPIGKLLVECETEIIISRIVGLWLAECEIEDDPMKILGKLPCLEYLRLSKRSFLGEEMKCHAFGFPRLKNLLLACLPNLRKWRVEQGAMPLLSSLHIYHCSHLKKVPDGLRFVVSLQKLTIEGMPQFAKRVLAPSDHQRRGEDYDKVSHVPSIIILSNGDDESN